jgi:CBS domain-containing protein
MKIREVMIEGADLIGFEDRIADVATKMMRADIGCLVVTNGSRVAGVITERELALGCLVEGHNSWECRVYRHMRIQPYTTHPDMDVSDAADLMMDKYIDYLPVVEGGRIAGVVFYMDLLRIIEKEMATPLEPSAAVSV